MICFRNFEIWKKKKKGLIFQLVHPGRATQMWWFVIEGNKHSKLLSRGFIVLFSVPFLFRKSSLFSHSLISVSLGLFKSSSSYMQEAHRFFRRSAMKFDLFLETSVWSWSSPFFHHSMILRSVWALRRFSLLINKPLVWSANHLHSSEFY